jgi:hypothetical protein
LYAAALVFSKHQRFACRVRAGIALYSLQRSTNMGTVLDLPLTSDRHSIQGVLLITMSDDLDEFFDDRDERLNEKKARETKQEQEAEKQRQLQARMARLVVEKGVAEYQALQKAVQDLARRFESRGFEVAGNRVLLNKCQALFHVSNTVNGRLSNPGVAFSPMAIGAMQSPQRKTVGIEPVASEGDTLMWRSSEFSEPKSTSELAAWIIKELANFADEEENRIVL